MTQKVGVVRQTGFEVGVELEYGPLRAQVDGSQSYSRNLKSLQSIYQRARLPLREGQQAPRRVLAHVNGAERTGVALQHLLLLLLGRIQLDVAVDRLAAVGRRNARQEAPVPRLVHGVGDDLRQF